MSAILARLKAAWPTFKVQSEPSPTCPNCHGSGEYTNRLGQRHICLCVCIGGSDELRGLAAEALHKKVPQSLRGEV